MTVNQNVVFPYCGFISNKDAVLNHVCATMAQLSSILQYLSHYVRWFYKPASRGLPQKHSFSGQEGLRAENTAA